MRGEGEEISALTLREGERERRTTVPTRTDKEEKMRIETC
jgi:hypothetical protein